jgi:hypothetical protein
MRQKTALFIMVTLLLSLIACSKPTYQPSQAPSGGGCGVQAPAPNQPIQSHDYSYSMSFPSKQLDTITIPPKIEESERIARY